MSPSLSSLYSLAKDYRDNNPELREGQSLKIALMDINKDLYIDIMGMDIDPFYIDARIPKFIEYITPRLS